MQVSQVTDHVTHAVIGGQKIIDFGISDDATLMNVLSKALYTDPQLAVIRETLCNAWDAHIEAGCTDKPFSITLDDEELVVRDFGFGIPFDLIGPIYGTYGASTKRSNTAVTGGFGLGCKSPFALVDNFEVTSWSKTDGKMTIYNVSKSNAEINGKPGITPIVSVPTTEQGLQVRIKLNNRQERHRLELLIRRIASNGEMNVLLNNVLVPPLPFHKVTSNYMMVKHAVVETNQKILLRYGHVIYPVDWADEYDSEYARINKLLGQLADANGYRGDNNGYKVIFQAPADKISITPSREALSLQEDTVQTIKELLVAFLADVEPKIEKGCYDLMKTSVHNAWLTGNIGSLFETSGRIANLPEQQASPVVVNTDQFIAAYASRSYPKYNGFAEKEQMERLDALLMSSSVPKHLVASYKKQILVKKSQGGRGIEPGPAWFQKEIAWPLVKGIAASEGAMSTDKLFFYTKEGSSGRWHRELKLYRAKDFPRKAIEEHLRWVRKIVILAHNRLDFDSRAKQFPAIKHWFKNIEDSVLYTVPRSPKKVEQAREFFTKRGYVLIDLTIAQPWEHVQAAAPIIREYVVKPRRKGIPNLKSALSVAYPDHAPNFKLVPKIVTGLLEKPEFVIKVNTKSEDSFFPEMSTKTTRFIIETWGDKGGYVVNENQKARYIGEGAMAFEDFVLGKILHEFKTNPRIIESLPFRWNRSEVIMKKSYGRLDYTKEHVWLEAIYAAPDLVEYFGIVQTMTPEDLIYLQMWDEFRSYHRVGTKGIYDEISEVLATFKIASEVETLFDTIRKADLLHTLNRDFVKDVMIGRQVISSQRKIIVRDMLLQALEG
jgi:hypothetical protein